MFNKLFRRTNTMSTSSRDVASKSYNQPMFKGYKLFLQASKPKTTRGKKINRRKKLALVLPAHNEELIIANTIMSAIKAGMKRRYLCCGR